MTVALRMSSFTTKLNAAIDQVKLVLDAARSPGLAGEVPHRYEDKYFLAECLTNTATASQVNCLAELGLSGEMLATLRDWAKGSAVQLRLRSETFCEFEREVTRTVESATKHKTELAIGGAVRAALTSSTTTEVTDYYFKYRVSYELLALRGVGEHEADRIVLLSRESSDDIMRSSKSLPYPAAKVPAALLDLNISWLLRQLQDAPGTVVPRFVINRSHAKCHTPRRNPDADGAIAHFASFAAWAQEVAHYMDQLIRGATNFKNEDGTARSSPDMAKYQKVLIPVLPLFEERAGPGALEAGPAAADTAEVALALRLPSDSQEEGCPLLDVSDTNRFLAEEMRRLREVREEVAQILPDTTSASASEGRLAVAMWHCADVCLQWADTMDYIEHMLRAQVIAAIGKEVTPADFKEYMEFHNRKLFAPAFLPTPFCFAVRRSNEHSPEGTLSIEGKVEGAGGDARIAAPVVTVVARTTSPSVMKFPLGASTHISFGGDRYLHAYLSHQFTGASGTSLSLVARARQFSSFLVLVGRITSATTLEPKFAAIIQNKDELTIPLDLSTIPTPKEFRDAIESLSPEQQAFCKAFRSMQLESTLFGVLVIQIKPQLEKVLNLAPDSLTKEIKLTQDLMNLFIKYQIPSDLLSFDPVDEETGAEVVGANGADKLASVKHHVSAINQMLDEAKKEDIAERRREEEFRNPQPTKGGKGKAKGGGSLPESEVRAMSFGGAQPRMMMMCSASSAAMPQDAPPFAPPPPASAAGPPGPPGPPPAPPGASNVRKSAGPSPTPPSASDVTKTGDSQRTPQSQGPPDTSALVDGRDLTQVPKEIDRRVEALDTDAALRPTIITPSDVWTKRAQKALLADPTTSTLTGDAQKKEKDAAFDLLDALTKSGGLPVEHASLHVVIAATHCFDKTILETVVQDNVNPIDKVERSTLIMASTVHQEPVSSLIQPAHAQRVAAASPQLFLEDSATRL